VIETKGYATHDDKAKFVPFDFSRRDLGPHDILMDIQYCGICHSDIHQAKNEWQNSMYPMVPGHEQCRARMNADGVLELAIGAHSHGQSMETTLAQVANQVLGIDVGRLAAWSTTAAVALGRKEAPIVANPDTDEVLRIIDTKASLLLTEEDGRSGGYMKTELSGWVKGGG